MDAENLQELSKDHQELKREHEEFTKILMNVSNKLDRLVEIMEESRRKPTDISM